MSAINAAQAANDSLVPLATDAKMASELPHDDLGRAEALDLLEGVFGPTLQGSAGGFDSLDVEKFISNNAAVVLPPSGDLPPAAGEAPESADRAPALLESTLPLRVPGPDGTSEAVDLSLEQVEGQLQPAVPLVPVAIPGELGQGVELPKEDVRIELVGAPEERAPSIIEESVAAYPNVATDTDFAVAPTPTGVETLTTLRTPDAPREQTFLFDLPAKATLVEVGEAAEVVRDGKTILTIQPATAIDATGAAVPVSMVIRENTLTLTVSPQAGAAYPILVDPLYQGWSWYNNQTSGYAGWRPWTNTATLIPGFGTNWGPEYNGTYIEAQAAYYPFNSEAMWDHGVPRLAEEEALGRYPTSFINALSVYGISHISSPGLASPFLFSGIFDSPTSKWAGSPGSEAVWSHAGNGGWLTEGYLHFVNGGDKNAKLAVLQAQAVSEPGSLTSPRASYVAAASVEVSDVDVPTVANPSAPTSWVNQAPAGPITVTATDTGLGVKSAIFGLPGGSKAMFNPCLGTEASPCPRTWTASLPASLYNVSEMPQGTNYVDIKAEDPLGNIVPAGSVARAQIKVDHTKPSLALSGTLTQQASIGTTRPQYTLKYTATDGTGAAPQSGVVSEEVKVDGKQVDVGSPGCTTQNCSISREWTLSAGAFSVGKHSVEIRAVDAVGLVTSQTLNIELQPDITNPTLNASGQLKTPSGGWLLSPGSYSATAVATDGGSGVAALILSVDGAKTAEFTNSCVAGGCAFNHALTLSAANYPPGEHGITVTAKDAAGNSSQSSWTIKINALGAATPTGVAATANALIPGSGEESPASKIGGFAYQASLDSPDTLGNLPITGSGVSGDMSLEAKEGTSISGLAGLPIVMAPTTGVVGSTIGESVAEGGGIAYPNVGTNRDLLARPIRNGVTNVITYRAADAIGLTSWQVVGPEATTLRTRLSDGAVEVLVDPSIPVPNFSIGGELSSAEQVVSVIDPPVAIDGAGGKVASSLSVEGNEVKLSVSPAGGAIYPIAAEVSLHVTGPIQGWNPETQAGAAPGDETASGIGISGSGEPLPVPTDWEVNASGSELTGWLAEPSGAMTAHSVPMNPAPGTVVEGVQVAAPVGPYAPGPTATASCILGIGCAGVVNCGIDVPGQPYGVGGLTVQAYTIALCSLSGDLSPNFHYVTGGACVRNRIGTSGHYLWVFAKCKEEHSVSPNWGTTVVVTKTCSKGEIYRGYGFGGPTYQASVWVDKWSNDSFKC